MKEMSIPTLALHRTVVLYNWNVHRSVAEKSCGYQCHRLQETQETPTRLWVGALTDRRKNCSLASAQVSSFWPFDLTLKRYFQTFVSFMGFKLFPVTV